VTAPGGQQAAGGEGGQALSLRLPQVDKLLRHPDMKERESSFRREYLAVLTRSVLDEMRKSAQKAKNSNAQAAFVDENAIVKRVLEQADALTHGSLKRVVNGTGVILNTNLGRAPLSDALVERLTQLLPGYSSLEVDLDNGQRGERVAGVERLLTVLTG
jgi:L-seryl-tRNA(Ser) seleniumtransferase